ncbi:hypothetical protein AAG906_035860 [Vitis piasezkii]
MHNERSQILPAAQPLQELLPLMKGNNQKGNSACPVPLVIKEQHVQMRNVILSAFPRNMRLPDPSTPNLKIDLLAEINQSPRIFSEVDAALKSKQMKSDVDEYLKTRHQGSSFLPDLKQRLLLPQNEAAQAGTQTCFSILRWTQTCR